MILQKLEGSEESLEAVGLRCVCSSFMAFASSVGDGQILYDIIRKHSLFRLGFGRKWQKQLKIEIKKRAILGIACCISERAQMSPRNIKMATIWPQSPSPATWTWQNCSSMNASGSNFIPGSLGFGQTFFRC